MNHKNLDSISTEVLNHLTENKPGKYKIELTTNNFNKIYFMENKQIYGIEQTAIILEKDRLFYRKVCEIKDTLTAKHGLFYTKLEKVESLANAKSKISFKIYDHKNLSKECLEKIIYN
jgi:hypothetical protein